MRKKSLKLSNKTKKFKSQLWKESCWRRMKELRDSTRSSGYCPTFLGLGLMQRMKKAWLLQNKGRTLDHPPLHADPGTLHTSVCQLHLSPSQLGCEVLQRLLEFGHQCGGPRPEPSAPAPQLPSLAIGSFSPLENLRHHLQNKEITKTH